MARLSPRSLQQHSPAPPRPAPTPPAPPRPAPPRHPPTRAAPTPPATPRPAPPRHPPTRPAPTPPAPPAPPRPARLAPWPLNSIQHVPLMRTRRHRLKVGIPPPPRQTLAAADVISLVEARLTATGQHAMSARERRGGKPFGDPFGVLSRQHLGIAGVAGRQGLPAGQTCAHSLRTGKHIIKALFCGTRYGVRECFSAVPNLSRPHLPMQSPPLPRHPTLELRLCVSL